MQITYGQNEWLAIGGGGWTWADGVIRQTAVGSGAVADLYFHNGANELKRTVAARLHFTAIGDENDVDGGPGITILNMGLAGISLVVNAGRGIFFIEDFWTYSEQSISFTPTLGTYVWLKCFYDPATNTCYGKHWIDGDAEPSQWQITYQPDFHGNAGDSSAEDFIYVGVSGNPDAGQTTADIDSFSVVLASETRAFRPLIRPTNRLIGSGIGD
jgi:hypothetical protein